MYSSSVSEFYQDLLLLLLLQEIKLLHGYQVDSNVVAFCKDRDVLMLMVWTYSKLNITNNWYLKYDHKKFADIRKMFLPRQNIVFEFTENTGLNRIQYHILQGRSNWGARGAMAPSTLIFEPNKVQQFQFQTSGIMLFMGVHKLYGPKILQFYQVCYNI